MWSVTGSSFLNQGLNRKSRVPSGAPALYAERQRGTKMGTNLECEGWQGGQRVRAGLTGWRAGHEARAPGRLGPLW